MRQIKRVLAIKSLALHGRDCYFFHERKSWGKFSRPRQKLAQVFPAPNTGDISNFARCKLAISVLVLRSVGIFSCANMSTGVIIFGSVKYCTTQQPNVVHACGNQCRKVSRTAARQFPALNFTVRELETSKYKSYSNTVSCWFNILFLALLKEFYFFEALRRISLYGCL